MSVAKTLGVLYAALGLLFGALVALFSMAAPGMGFGRGGGFFPMMGGVASIIVLPIIYGVIGFVVGLITAWIYNMVAGATGGIEIELN
jgi:hypothetical protein